MKRLRESVTFKFREKASLFLTELHPASDAVARAAALSSVRKRDYDATHHCSAWREGLPVTAFGSDDDGEPSGTAGSPMLKVLEGEEITDILVLCVRWYGGTKLGTGGLVRAYTDGVQGAVAEGERLGFFEEARILIEGSIEAPQEMAHLPFTVLRCFKNVEILGQDYDAAISKLAFRLPPEDCPNLEKAWRERSRGGIIKWNTNE
ncbi:MAG: YigZ family protein [Holophagales bacterium]|jgi:putative IMPACT (imprinted ancient) family translation regulator|nr:YigZ family protein [Holophagales bacterium]